MFSLRYIHAADLHLDASFKGLRRQKSLSSQERGPLEHILRTASFTALERLVALCEREKPDFLVLAGDVYNEEDQSLKAQLALRDACARLDKCGIAVFIVHGNHDPLSSRLKTLQWPTNTTIFETEMGHEVVLHRQLGTPVAVVHGVSHASAKESRNLATAFTRLGGEYEKIFQLGVLHCTLDAVPSAERYAPCTVQDLEATRLDAFALGHVHEERVVLPSPFVAYSGNTQGLHINETGPKGCLLVTVTAQEEAEHHGAAPFAVTSTFHALGPVLWEKCEIALDSIEHINEVEERIQEALEDILAHTPLYCQALVVRICLTGHTPLDGELRYKDFCEELTERLQNQQNTEQQQGQCLLWLKDIVVETSPLVAMDEMRKRDDLLGETLRLGLLLGQESKNAEDFVRTALHPLFAHNKAKYILEFPNANQSQELMEEAQRLCADIMESR